MDSKSFKGYSSGVQTNPSLSSLIKDTLRSSKVSFISRMFCLEYRYICNLIETLQEFEVERVKHAL